MFFVLCSYTCRHKHMFLTCLSFWLCHTGYSPPFHPSSSQQRSISPPAVVHDSGPQEHPAFPVLEVRTDKSWLLWMAFYKLKTKLRKKERSTPKTSHTNSRFHHYLSITEMTPNQPLVSTSYLLTFALIIEITDINHSFSQWQIQGKQ